MGATDFFEIARGKTAKEAFKNARKQAQYDYGHGGYTGSIAEKNSFIVFSVPSNMDPHKYAEKLVYEDDSRITDKYGPAGCIRINDDEYLFFGYAAC